MAKAITTTTVTVIYIDIFSGTKQKRKQRDLAEGFSWGAAFGVESSESGAVIVWAWASLRAGNV